MKKTVVSCFAGLPEEMLMVAAAVKRGYAIIAVGPHLSGDELRCWQKTWPPEKGIEIPEVCCCPCDGGSYARLVMKQCPKNGLPSVSFHHQMALWEPVPMGVPLRRSH